MVERREADGGAPVLWTPDRDRVERAVITRFRRHLKESRGLDFATYEAAKKAGATLGYGSFITVTVNFLIIAWVLFLVIKGLNRVNREEQAAPPPPAPPTKEELLLTEIRDLLRARG